MTPNHQYKPILLDLLVINIVYCSLYYYHEEIGFNILFISFLTTLTWVALSLSLHLYPWLGNYSVRTYIGRFWITLSSHFSFLFLSNMLLTNLFGITKLFYGEALLILLVLFPVIKLLYKATYRYFFRPFNYIIIGGKLENIETITNKFYTHYGENALCVGRFGNTPNDLVRNLGNYFDIKNYLLTNDNIRRLVYVYSDLSKSEIQDIFKICSANFIDIMIFPREIDLFPRGFNTEYYYDTPFYMARTEPLGRLRNKLVKRLFDLLFSSLVIILIFPWLIPIIGLLIKLESKGPIFFIQKRSGYFGKEFYCYKFRSMTMNDESDDKQATKYDSRITQIGAFIRKTNIDEIPQFLNVFMGQMSVVGPRPHMLKHTAFYSNRIQDFMIRHKIKPGITGWAQINGYRGPTETVEKMNKRVQYDIWYMENWTILLDIECIFRTILNGLKGEENAF